MLNVECKGRNHLVLVAKPSFNIESQFALIGTIDIVLGEVDR